MMMLRKALTVVVLAGAITSTGVIASSAEQARYPVAPWMNRACPTEDSLNCFWDAKHRGDRHGDSFYVRHMPNTQLVCTLYPAKPRLDYCIRDKSLK